MGQAASTGRIAARLLACLLLAFTALPATLEAQKPPLAEVARKEQERRKTSKDAPKKLTNSDLPESALKPQGPPPAAAEAPAAESQGSDASAAGASAAGGNEDSQKGEAWWRERIESAREELRRNQAFIEALQSRVNALTTDFVNRDDPYQRAKIGEDRQKALDEMARLKSEIANGQKQIQAIEEEARKAGVPPGWLR